MYTTLLKYVERNCQRVPGEKKTQAQWCLNKGLAKFTKVYFDFPERMCMHQSLSLFTFAYGVDPDQTRMFCQFKKFVHALESMQNINTVDV